MGDVGALVAETHGADESFVFDGPASKVRSNYGFGQL